MYNKQKQKEISKDSASWTFFIYSMYYRFNSFLTPPPPYDVVGVFLPFVKCLKASQCIQLFWFYGCSNIWNTDESIQMSQPVTINTKKVVQNHYSKF